MRLPLRYEGITELGAEGLEPPAYWLKISHSTRLSYTPDTHAPSGTRTRARTFVRSETPKRASPGKLLIPP